LFPECKIQSPCQLEGLLEDQLAGTRGVDTPRVHESLAGDPRLLQYVEDLCGPGYRLDRAVQALAPASAGRIVGGDADPARAYFHELGYLAHSLQPEVMAGLGARAARSGTANESAEPGMPWDSAESPTDRIRVCQGLLVVFALSDIPEGTGFALAPCSHMANFPPPPSPLGAAAHLQVRGSAGMCLLCKPIYR
jgi:hypothetical protein